MISTNHTDIKFVSKMDPQILNDLPLPREGFDLEKSKTSIEDKEDD
jgi:hypothetical protein